MSKLNTWTTACPEWTASSAEIAYRTGEAMTVQRYMARIIGADPQHDTPVPVVLTADYDAVLQANKDCVAWFEAAKSERDALAARVALLEGLIDQHNSACQQNCEACGEAGRCAPYTDRGRECPDCARDWLIALPAADGGKHES